MSSTGKNTVRVAVIDMNNGVANQGMRGILSVLENYRESTGTVLEYEVFDLRLKGEIPSLNYDIYISSGGPGSPYDGEHEQWEADFFALLEGIESHNKQSAGPKKHAFLICHSFQMACRKYQVGQVISRRSTAFGIFPVFLTEEGENELIFSGMPNPFYTVDSRDWQVVNPDDLAFPNTEATVLALEKDRPHVDLERCVMAVRFTNEIIGTQFHPEADAEGMKMYLLMEDKKAAITANYGKQKYQDMLQSLDDPKKIRLTQQLILPNFLNEALNALEEA